MKYDKSYETDDMPVKAGNKGFYIALAVCLVAVCGVAVSTFVGGLSTDTPETPTTVTTPTTVAQVDNPASDVKDERPTTTTTSVTTTTTSRTSAPTTTTTAATDLFVFPASNRVLTPYSDKPVYSETLGEWSTHNGVDFAAESGQNVKAAADGTIARIYRDALWGDVVEIQHGGNVLSRYYGVKDKGIKEGQAVKAGSVIGTVTDIPAEIVMKPHVHIEVLANDKYVDPLTLIRGETVTTTTTIATTTENTTAIAE